MRKEEPPFDLLTRIVLLEARMRLVVLFLEGLIAVVATALLGYFFGR